MNKPWVCITMDYMKATTTSADAVTKSNVEGFTPGDIVQWSHELKGRAVSAYGEVSAVMRKNMWVNLLGKEWKVAIHEAILVYRPETEEENEENEEND